jgi:uncharacterized membrane protein YphA (DoxX/SURF4 family)
MVIAFTFMFSGFVKGVDPMGFTIKIEDYLIAFHMEWLSPIALPTAIFLIALEFLVGFYLFIGFHIRRLSPIVLIMMIMFTLLTLYSAVFNPVSDCGCFGDAVKLTNWQTFWKNIALMVFTLGLFYLRKGYDASPSRNLGMIMAATLGLIYIVGLEIYSYRNLPILDFRPYKTGVSIAEGMSIPDDAEQPVLETLFIMEKNGERQTFTTENYPYTDSTWVFIDSETRTIKEGYTPPLYNFSLTHPELGDVTGSVAHHNGAQFLLIAPYLNKVDKKLMPKIVELANAARQHEIPFYCITSSSMTEATQFDIANNMMLDYLQGDETMLKTIIRSNPGLVLLYNGVVVGKWHYRNIPEKEIVNNPLSVAVKQLYSNRNLMVIWFNILIMIIIPSLFINRKTINRKK